MNRSKGDNSNAENYVTKAQSTTPTTSSEGDNIIRSPIMVSQSKSDGKRNSNYDNLTAGNDKNSAISKLYWATRRES